MSRSTQSIQRSTRRRFAAILAAGALIAASVAVPAVAYADVANPTDPVVFEDAGLEACVATSLGIEPGVAVTQGDLATLTTLDCQASGISNLAALQFATNLTTVNLVDNAIADASALSTLTGLTDVVLTGQVLQLPDAGAGEDIDLPAVKDLHGDAVAVDVSSASQSVGTVTNNVVNWTCAGSGRLDWLTTTTYGDSGATTTFSGRMLQEVSQGTAPACALTSAPKPLIKGTPRSGSTLTMSTGTWAPAPVALTIQWNRAGVPIDGATTKTHVVSATDAGKAITVTVTGSKNGYATTASTSAALTIEKLLTASPTPTISGVRRVGSVLTATIGTWTPTGVTLAFRWKRNGVGIWGAASKTYTLVKADAGTKITFAVTGSKSGYTTVSRVSAASSIEKLLTATPVPAISGTARVGLTLTAKPGAWTPSPVTLTYRWKRDGAGITGATTPNYKLVASDAGRLITVAVAGVKSGYTTVSKTSPGLRIEKLLLTAAPVPTVTGVAATARMLTAHPGTWGPSPVQLAYQWQRNGVDIPGATASTYVPSGPDIGKRISVVVRGSKLGYYTKLRFSTGTAAIVLSIAIPGDGTYRMGSNLSAGTYVTRTATNGCYWERLSGFDGSFNSIITNDYGSGQRIVTISASDAGFKTEDCGSWIRLKDSAAAAKATVPNVGMFAVGRQITPGLYTAPGGNGCYWETLTGFDGSFNSIIANDFSYYTRQEVNIGVGVVGFQTEDCGTWTRL